MKMSNSWRKRINIAMFLFTLMMGMFMCGCGGYYVGKGAFGALIAVFGGIFIVGMVAPTLYREIKKKEDSG